MVQNQVNQLASHLVRKWKHSAAFYRKEQEESVFLDWGRGGGKGVKMRPKRSWINKFGQPSRL